MPFVIGKFSKKFRLIISRRALAYRLALKLLIIVFCFSSATEAQVKISEDDLRETIKFYSNIKADNIVRVFQNRMRPPVTDPFLRAEAYRKMPALVRDNQINNQNLKLKFLKLIAPLLKFYRREGVYEIIIFHYKTPLILSIPGSLIIISDALLKEAQNDDELFGYVAHEVAHEFYVNYSDYTSYLLKLVTENGREPILYRKYFEARGIIELQCDSFAAFTLVTLGYNPLGYIESLERVSAKFPSTEVGYHPLDSDRRMINRTNTPPK